MTRVAPSPAPPGTVPRRVAGWRVVLLVAIVFVVFALVLPRIVDYPAVMAALRALTLPQALALVAASGLAYVASAAPFRVLVPAVSWPHAVGADLAGRAVASIIPGPTDLATRLVLYTQWGVGVETASAGLVIGGLLETLSALVLPLIAVLGIVLAGGSTPQATVWLAAFGVLVLALATAAVSALLRSESLARRLGVAADHVVRGACRVIRRSPPDGIVDGVMRLRASFHELLNRRGVAAFVAAVGAKLAWFIVLEVALTVCGVGTAVLSPGTVLTAMAAVAIVALIPITPGALGVSELTYVAVFSLVVDPAYAGQVAAAIMLYRAAQWLVPIPLGWALLVVMRRGHGILAEDA